MSFFVSSTQPKEPRTKDSAKVALFYAGILVVMAVAQLFTFDEFLPYIQSINLPLGNNAAYLLAPLIVISEVFALPFLLRMWLSPAFRFVSMFLGWLAAVTWVFIAFWLASTHSAISSIGFLGTVVDIAPGWWAVFISLLLVVLAAWSSWGLWPGKRAKN
jgi:hypothetical protein